MENVVFTQLSIPEIRQLFRQELSTFFESTTVNANTKEVEKLLSPADTCKLFSPTISKPTIIRWTKEGLLKSYRIGGRVFYKQSEIIEAAKHLKPYKKA